MAARPVLGASSGWAPVRCRWRWWPPSRAAGSWRGAAWSPACSPRRVPPGSWCSCRSSPGWPRTTGGAPRPSRRRPVRAGRRPARAVAAARPPARPRHHRLRRARPTRRWRVAAPRATPARLAVRRAARRRPHRGVLAARRQLRRLRRVDQRPGRHPLHPRRARPRHADDDRRRPARARRGLRHRRHDLLGLADRPGRPADPARGLLHAARRLAVPAAVAASATEVHVSMLAFILFYGLDWVATVPADDGAVPQRLRRARAGRLRLGLRRRTRSGPPPRRSGRASCATSSATYDLAWYVAGALCLVAAVDVRRDHDRSSVRCVTSAHRLWRGGATGGTVRP